MGRVGSVEAVLFGSKHCGQCFPAIFWWRDAKPTFLRKQKTPEVPLRLIVSVWVKMPGFYEATQCATTRCVATQHHPSKCRALTQALASNGTDFQFYYPPTACFGVTTKIDRGNTVSSVSYRSALSKAILLAPRAPLQKNSYFFTL